MIAVALQQFLLLLDVVVDDAGVRRGVENLSPVVVREEVHALVDVLVEAVHLLEGLRTGNETEGAQISISYSVCGYKN